MAISKPVSLFELWVGILAGPFAWAFDEVVGYSATAHECSTGTMLLLHSLTVGCLAACLIGLWAAWKAESTLRVNQGEVQVARAQRIHFMAIGGMILSVGFAMVILATAIPKWMLSPCD